MVEVGAWVAKVQRRSYWLEIETKSFPGKETKQK